MLDSIYNALAAVGFTHPLHPVATHIPMGMVLGGFIIKLASYKWERLSNTADHCYTMALIISPITIIFGFMDWQHRYYGILNKLFTAKIILAVLIFILLAIFTYTNYKEKLNGKIKLVLYIIIFLIALGLGMIGGQIVYG